jgi:glycosyltransferase involved in cell wall biosynthesis
MAELRVIVPAQNESCRIVHTLRDYCEHFGEVATILVVANGCSDDTAEVVRSLMLDYPNLRLIDVPAKIGKGGAVRVGLKMCDEAFVGFTDADGSTSAREFDRLLQAVREEQCGGAIGSRWSRGSEVSPPQSFKRRFASRVFNLIVRGLFGLRFRDTQCGAKVFRAAAIAPVLDKLELSNFAFDVDVLAQLHWAGVKVREVPIRWSDVSNGTKIRLVASSRSMLAAIVRLRLRESFLGGVPYLDYFARRTVIPVRREFSLLVLAADHPDDPAAEPAALALREYLQQWIKLGHRVTWVCAAKAPARRTYRDWPLLVYAVGGWFPRLRTLLWYVFSSRRDYDAVFEVAGKRPFLIPGISVKRTFLVVGAPGALPAFANALYRCFYRRTQVIRHDVSHLAEQVLVADGWTRNADPDRLHAESIIAGLEHSHPHAATFVRSEAGWSLRYRDVAGNPRETLLR